jgi:hypothetical protein
MSYGQGKAGERLKAAVHKAVRERILAQRPDTTPDELDATCKEIDDDIEAAIEDPAAAERAQTGHEPESEGTTESSPHKAPHGKGHK